MHYLLSKLKMKDVMTKRVVTVGDDCPLEEAARIMVDYKIGCLPIVKDDKLVGIITETDIFKTFVEILGGREKGLRLTLDVTEGKGVLAAIAAEIAKHDGNIVSLATFCGRDTDDRIVTVKVTGAPKDASAEKPRRRARQGAQRRRYDRGRLRPQDHRSEGKALGRVGRSLRDRYGVTNPSPDSPLPRGLFPVLLSSIFLLPSGISGTKTAFPRSFVASRIRSSMARLQSVRFRDTPS